MAFPVPYLLDSHLLPLLESLGSAVLCDLIVPSKYSSSTAGQSTSLQQLQSLENVNKLFEFPDFLDQDNSWTCLIKAKKLLPHLRLVNYELGILYLGSENVSHTVIYAALSCRKRLIWYPTNNRLLQQTSFTEVFTHTNSVDAALATLHTHWRDKRSRLKKFKNYRPLALLRTFQVFVKEISIRSFVQVVLPVVLGLPFMSLRIREYKTGTLIQRGEIYVVNSPLARRIQEQLNPGARVYHCRHPALEKQVSLHSVGTNDGCSTPTCLILMDSDLSVDIRKFFEYVLLTWKPDLFSYSLRFHPNSDATWVKEVTAVLGKRASNLQIFGRDKSLRQVLDEVEPSVVVSGPSAALWDALALASKAEIYGILTEPTSENQPLGCRGPYMIGEETIGQSGVNWVDLHSGGLRSESVNRMRDMTDLASLKDVINDWLR